MRIPGSESDVAADGPAAQPQVCDIERAAVEMDGQLMLVDLDTPPAGSRGEQAAEITAGRRSEGELAAWGIPLHTARSEQKRPRRERSCVVVAAFDLVPRTAVTPVIPPAQRTLDEDRVIDAAGIEKRGRDLMLDSRPHLVGVDEGDRRASTVRPGCEQEPTFVVQGVDALRALVRRQVVTVIVRHDRGKRRIDSFRGRMCPRPFTNAWNCPRS